MYPTVKNIDFKNFFQSVPKHYVGGVNACKVIVSLPWFFVIIVLRTEKDLNLNGNN